MLRFRERTLALVLSGAGRDGAAGAGAVKRCGGLVLAQDEETSFAFGMPGAAIADTRVDLVLSLSAIAPALVSLTMLPGVAAHLGFGTTWLPEAEWMRSTRRRRIAGRA
ncbi:MAG TPA: chemotaxis protein CheB [Polyangiaceae bacterium]|nr:chemotaxis protein CheB [Polyangiaceae bacterium]